mmetsp:Transcript_8137/g.25426  ORF Transcript_8137/g.25426 Transcript_8137/m.25426 type:complete len:262 (+) Transcript_8137:189-974(+)
MLREVRDALLGHDDVGRKGDDLGANLLDRLLLLAQQLLPSLVVRHLDVRRRLVLLVLERAVEQQHARLLDAPPHLCVDQVLVNHHALEHARVLEVAARDLLDLCVPLDVELFASSVVEEDRLDGVKRELDQHVRELRDELSARARLHEPRQLLRVCHVDGARNLVEGGERVVERLEVPVANRRRVQLPLEQRRGEVEVLASQHDDGRRAVANLLVLRARELDHGLGRGVRDVHLAQDGVAVVGHHDPTHWVEEHLEHRARA